MTRLSALVLAACLAGCDEGVNGVTPPPNPPRPSSVEFPDLRVEVGQSVLLEVDALFHGDHLRYTAASSDTTVATLELQSDQLAIKGVTPGTAEVSVTATEPAGHPRQPEGPQGRSATRNATVTVVEPG